MYKMFLMTWLKSKIGKNGVVFWPIKTPIAYSKKTLTLYIFLFKRSKSKNRIVHFRKANDFFLPTTGTGSKMLQLGNWQSHVFIHNWVLYTIFYDSPQSFFEGRDLFCLYNWKYSTLSGQLNHFKQDAVIKTVILTRKCLPLNMKHPVTIIYLLV